MIISYIDQLEEAARVAKVRLKDAYLHGGLSESNYYRHRRGEADISEKLAIRVFAAIRSLEKERRDRLSRIERSLQL